MCIELIQLIHVVPTMPGTLLACINQPLLCALEMHLLQLTAPCCSSTIFMQPMTMHLQFKLETASQQLMTDMP